MLLIWTVAWSIFAANPLATYGAERAVERSFAEQADVAARIVASKAGTAAAIAAAQGLRR
jgi:hypothetical protein